jgi:hypothetical protein
VRDRLIDLLPGVSYARNPSDPESVSGSTASGDTAEGRRWSWELRIGDLPFAIWESLWSTGERELVLADQEVTSATPVSVCKLMSRRRALIEQGPNVLYVAARQVLPDADEWPRFSNCSEADLDRLIPPHAAAVLSRLGYLGYGTRADVLGSTARNRSQILGLFRPDSRAATVGFYILTRVLPTFRKAGML